jgi:bifunctional non-homologous end joining protein LigD
VSPERVETEIDGNRLSLSNLDKVVYPDTGFTKGQVLDYYARIADVMLAHLKDRPVTLKRFPGGVEGKSFYQKHALKDLPDWVCTTDVPSATAGKEPIEFAVVCDRSTLMWAVNLASLEFHVPLWHVAKVKPLPAPPDYMVFDLDPGPGTSIVQCCRVAQWIGEYFGEEMLFPKTSGSKGLQLYMPVRRTTWEKSNQRAHELAQTIEKDHGDAVVSVMRKSLRDGKVLIDWSQNNPSKTTICAYSLRARPEPTVSTPVTWKEVHDCVKSARASDLRFTTDDVLTRVEKLGDLFKPLVRK